MVASTLALLAPLIALPLVSAGTGASIFRKRDACASSVESCSSGANSASACCVNKPGGQLLQTQFWDTNPAVGPSNSWTIHGLWPDNCDGTYSENCDSSRAYSDITQLIQQYGSPSLLQYMQTYWLSNDESPEKFWEHEWSTHGTCVSTLAPDCGNYQEGEEAAAFFQIVVNLFKTLDTYSTLASAGIVPSNSATYSSREIISAISSSFGADPVILCKSNTLSQIYYGFFVDGPLSNEKFVPAGVVGQGSKCPSSGIRYPVKPGGSAPTRTTTAIGVPTATGAVSGTGNWNTYYDGQQDGCLISEGTWYIGGSCATYKSTPSDGGITLSTSKGDCGVVGGAFSCGGDVDPTTFSVIGGQLAYNGQTTFYATRLPEGSEQAKVWTDYGSYSLTFEWVPTGGI